MVASVTPSASAAPPKPLPPFRPLAKGGRRAVKGAFGIVSSEDPIATRVAAKVLQDGGNAIDAAVALGYTLSVTHHVAGSLGGGGFMMVRLADGRSAAIDYREIAPAAATIKINNEQLAAGAHGYRSAPVPGIVAGLNLARDRFGSRPLAELLAPAIALAKKGHAYGRRPALVLSWFHKRIFHDPVLRKMLGRGPGHKKPLAYGQRIKQKALANTLEAIAKEGNDGFYKGQVAAKIARAMQKAGGLISVADLAAYQAKIRRPLQFDYRGYSVLTMPPPSMGGVALLAIMKHLEQSGAHRYRHGTTIATHLFLEAARRAYADRRSIGADPDFADANIVGPRRRRLLDSNYYATYKPAINLNAATPSKQITPLAQSFKSAAPSQAESSETTHFSVVDADGNAVACTTTLSAAFGAWMMVPETGVIFSNAMGAFSPSGINQLQPHKRMASSMTPTLVVSAGVTVAAIGSPGGDTIPGTVAQVLKNLIDDRMAIDAAIIAPRVHHQYLPDQFRTEKWNPLSKTTLEALKKMGHVYKERGAGLGDVNGIVLDRAAKMAWGYADRRKGGLAVAVPVSPTKSAQIEP